MLRWAIGLFFVAVLIGYYGFGGNPVPAVDAARAAFFVVLGLFLVTLFVGWGGNDQQILIRNDRQRR